MSSCLFSFSFIGHILALIKIYQNWVHFLNFLVTFLLLTTDIALYFFLSLYNLKGGGDNRRWKLKPISEHIYEIKLENVLYSVLEGCISC